MRGLGIVGLLSALVVSACGSKSGLGLGAAAGGSGGSPTGGGGTSTGGAGAGGTAGSGAGGSAGSGTGGSGASGGTAGSGGTVSCTTIELDGIATITGAWKTEELDPSLVLSSDDGENATLMFRWRDLDPEPGYVLNDKLGHIAFEAWASWPQDLGQAWVAETYGSGSSFALADAPSDEHAFLFYDDGTLIGPQGMYFVPAAFPKGSFERVALGTPGERALFAVHGESDHLLGFERGPPGPFGLTFGRFAGGMPSPDQNSGCATAPLSASAVRVPGAYLFAFTSSRDFSTCLEDLGFDGPPTRIQLARWEDGAVSPKLVDDFDAGAPVRQVALAKAGARLWLVHQLEGGVTYSGILARPFDAWGLPAGDAVTLVESGVTGGPVTATGLGERLALAFPISGPGPEQAQIDLFDSGGGYSAGVGLSNPSPTPYGLLGSPDGDRLLIAWASPDPTDGNRRIEVARLSCLNQLP